VGSKTALAGPSMRRFLAACLLCLASSEEEVTDVPEVHAACGACGTADAAADTAKANGGDVYAQASAAATASFHAAASMKIGLPQQSQSAGLAAAKVMQDAGQSQDVQIKVAAEEAAKASKALGESQQEQLNNAAITVTLLLKDTGSDTATSAQDRANAGKVAAINLAPSLFPTAEEQATAIAAVDGPISYVTGMVPVDPYHQTTLDPLTGAGSWASGEDGKSGQPAPAGFPGWLVVVLAVLVAGAATAACAWYSYGYQSSRAFVSKSDDEDEDGEDIE